MSTALRSLSRVRTARLGSTARTEPSAMPSANTAPAGEYYWGGKLMPSGTYPLRQELSRLVCSALVD